MAYLTGREGEERGEWCDRSGRQSAGSGKNGQQVVYFNEKI